MAGTTTAPPEQARSTKNEKVGEVVSASMSKTIVVQVTRRVSHPVYQRIISKRKKFYAHDEEQAANVGDVVRIIECRPMSKLKRWRLGEIVRKAVQVAVDPNSVDIETTQPAAGQKSPATDKKSVRRKS
ncbi:MAG: 30S ribosomal protein S17 [Acidobacteriaceae bacterium]|nr:30S ribosomal protein S17 [Acidobacteriaceae bacterium]